MQPPGKAEKPGEHALVGLIRNPRSHRNIGCAPELADDPCVFTETPRSHDDLRDVLAGFAARGIEYLAVDGGDGTVRDVLTCGAELFGENWPTLIVLPKGKTNALTVDLGLPNKWSLAEALEAAKGQNRVTRRPLRVVRADGTGETLQGFIMGAGAFTLGTDAGQEAHKLGAFNSFAVGLTILFGIFQTLFGLAGNPWRACTPMKLTHAADGTPLPHSRHGTPGERFVMVATTFERFPLGVRPFGSHVPPGLKLGLVDWPLRWMMALLPAILFGFLPGFIARNGAHRITARAVDMDLGGKFILDGEAYPPGAYRLDEGPLMCFVVP